MNETTLEIALKNKAVSDFSNAVLAKFDEQPTINVTDFLQVYIKFLTDLGVSVESADEDDEEEEIED
jgi:hypothetical protein